MTTNITELAQSLKAAAEKLDGAHWQTRKGFSGIEVIVKGSLEKRSGFTSFQPVAADLADTKTARAIALFSPANILALVEALEKAQRYIEELREWNAGLAQESFERQQRISELLEGKVGSALLERESHHVEVVGKLTELIEQLESRTVKLPPKVDSSNIPFAGHTWNCCLDEVEKRLAATGIKVEAE